MFRPRIRKEKRQRLSSSPAKEVSDYTFIPVSSPKRPSARDAQPIIFAADGQKFTQHSRLPLPVGQIGLRDRPKGELENSRMSKSETGQDNGSPSILPLESAPSRHQQKKLNQVNTWMTSVIPRLIKPYMRLLQETQNLRLESFAFISWSEYALIFALAVDIRLLNFVSRLFLKISPNNTAISNTLDEFLQAQGYQMKGEDPLRRRFGSALQWFNSLLHATTQFVDSIVAVTRDSLNVSDDTLDVQSNESASESHSSEEDESEPRKRTRPDPDSASLPLTRPSEYLRARCPLCFGGSSTMSKELSTIVCLDACFTQKHNKQKYRDPPREHPKTVFIPEDDVVIWEAFVPNAILDECERSFTAADGSREKASTQFFDSTALMGLLCCHDRVLWLVNMTTPGERQHYALALLDMLFKHIPLFWTVGVLYDVACTLDRSCVKWGFLADYLDRISFAISVFHAYGHGWVCQCVYHPRKCKGFGLSDGEGCERFWHSISKLIAYLRVCGHHTRLYTLDSQVQHLDNEGLMGLGKWIARKWHSAEVKRAEGDKDVKESEESPDFLRQQWAAQVAAQTKPPPRQSKNAGKKAVEEAVRLQKVRDSLTERIAKLEDVICDVDADPVDYAGAEDRLPGLKQQLDSCKSKLSRAERALGVQNQLHYRHFANSAYINHRINARALKIRLRERLCARKFERTRIERAARRQQYNERKIQGQTEDSVKRRDSGIQKLARSYNKHVSDMRELIRLHRAPRHAVAPQPIPTKGLFNLDIDDVIWEDVGLDEDDEEVPPPWMCDDKVKKGIRGILIRDRCDEDFRRLRHELRSMREWMAEEWKVVTETIELLEENDDPGLLHQLHERREHLLRLCVIWSHALHSIPSDGRLPAWGPSKDELTAAERELGAEILDEGESDVNELVPEELEWVAGETDEDEDEFDFDEDEDEFDFDEDELDVGLLEHMSAMAVVDTEDSELDDFV
ncbi:hypothetical protein DFJ43DRAFT_1154503 [Lentinula guzmanii]|uniref:CxC1-like cysteine cluster associated with KDZ transposases domain-containing protein n=1 Tax=Lentinula guzmanii TaxID=2804957 RepID=A0AA38JLC3_9AGAR|nr:hypothetical protein DFJ43DRAFT_1154503 [Lentinula guzmanii]